jgi:hypothetical protein
LFRAIDWTSGLSAAAGGFFGTVWSKLGELSSRSNERYVDASVAAN